MLRLPPFFAFDRASVVDDIVELLCASPPHCFHFATLALVIGHFLPLGSTLSLSESLAWRTHPPFFSFSFLLCSFCLQRTLIVRTLCAANCSKTKPKEEGGGGLVRVVTQCVYTALFSLCTFFTFFWISYGIQIEFDFYIYNYNIQ